MARPQKEGLDYFPLDVDFFDDPKILLIEERFGLKGSLITAKLLCLIYRNGYYLDWNNDMALVFAKRVGNGITHAFVSDVVSALIERGFFDKDIFSTRSILTSNGIQKRWLEIINKSKRKASIKEEHMVSSKVKGVSSEETTPKREETYLKREESTQSKVKKSKVIMEEITLDKCRLDKDDMHYKVIASSIKLYKGFKKAYPDNKLLLSVGAKEWIDPVRELIEAGYEYELHIAPVTNFATEDPFWRNVVTDTASLQKHFEKLKIKLNAKQSSY